MGKIQHITYQSNIVGSYSKGIALKLNDTNIYIYIYIYIYIKKLLSTIEPAPEIVHNNEYILILTFLHFLFTAFEVDSLTTHDGDSACLVHSSEMMVKAVFKASWPSLKLTRFNP